MARPVPVYMEVTPPGCKETWGNFGAINPLINQSDICKKNFYDPTQWLEILT